MGVFNPIPSMLGGWPEGTPTRNIPTEFILEDPVFKVSTMAVTSAPASSELRAESERLAEVVTKALRLQP